MWTLWSTRGWGPHRCTPHELAATARDLVLGNNSLRHQPLGAADPAPAPPPYPTVPDADNRLRLARRALATLAASLGNQHPAATTLPAMSRAIDLAEELGSAARDPGSVRGELGVHGEGSYGGRRPCSRQQLGSILIRAEIMKALFICS